MHRRKKHVLIVDDDKTTRFIVSSIFLNVDFDVTDAEDGPCAIDLINANPEKYDLIILDLFMPKMNGFETFLEIKKIREDIIVFIISGYDSGHPLIESSLKNGVKEYLKKPIKVDELLERLKKYSQESISN